MSTLCVVNRSPKPYGSPSGDIPSFGELEVPEVWWKTQPTSILVPADEYRARLDRKVGGDLRGEARRMGLPKLSKCSEAEIRHVARARLDANTADPDHEARDVYLDEWEYNAELWSSVAQTCKADDDLELPPSRKPTILADFMVNYYGTPEEAKESDVVVRGDD